MTTPPVTPSADGASAQGSRAFALVLVGMSAAVWWPAFTLGAWGVLFFDQLLTVWVVATTALVVVLVRRRARRRWLRVVALAVPSLWLALAFFDDTDSAGAYSVLVDIVGAFVGVLGIPFTLWTLVGVLWPELFTDLRRRARVGVVVTVVLVAVASVLLGALQDRFLTCQDFDISGNSRPPGCVSAPPDALTPP